MIDQINTVFLAAGKGTRLKQNTAKPLCTALGKPLVDYVVQELNEFSRVNGVKCYLNFVVGHQKENVQKHIEQRFKQLGAKFTWQRQQLGTGHAVQSFFKENSSAWNNPYTMIVCADTPLLTSNIFTELVRCMSESKAEAICASFNTDKPFGYGRIEHGGKGFKIIEEKDATTDQRKIKEVNSGLYLFKTEHIKKYIDSLSDNNNSGEFYLTDLFKQEDHVVTNNFGSTSSFFGVNDLVQLEEVENILLERKLNDLAMKGVRLYKSSTIYIEADVEVEEGCSLHPGVSLYGKTHIGANCKIENGVIIKDSIIGNGNTIKAYSYLEKVKVGDQVQIGPMARLREGSNIDDDCKIGNFVETKKVKLSKGVKVSHLSYLGDTAVGENTNIGCGFISCNYDGLEKHETQIGKNSFIGSDCQMIAPIKIGDDVFIGSGSTINQDVPSGAFAIARTKQVIKPDAAKKFFKKK